MSNTILYAANVSCLADPELFRKAYDIVSLERQAKVDRLRFAKDKYLSLGAGLLLKKAGFDSQELSFNEQGKPYFKNSSVYFNLSHSGEYALCAISDHEVGCDIEKIVPTDLKIAKRYFSVEEYEDIIAQPPEKQPERFFCYWTLKESFIKVTGLGLKLPLNSFTIVPENGISVKQSVDNRNYSFSQFSEIPGYACAVCIADETCDAELNIIDLRDFI